jgi:hypothetical protein
MTKEKNERRLPTPRFAGYPSTWKKGATPFLVLAVAIGVAIGLLPVLAVSYFE